MSKNYFKPKRIPFVDIREKAEEFRKEQSLSENQIPVPIESIVEFGLQLEITPIKGLKSKGDIDGFLSNDLKSIYLDYDMYWDDRYLPRLHFTLAHEVGHLIIHSDEITKIDFQNEDEWIKFRNEMDEDDLNWFEQQAHEFGGRLLVPLTPLKEALEGQREKVEIFRKMSQNNDEDRLIDAIARMINNDFAVSYEVIRKRIRVERLWNEMFPL